MATTRTRRTKAGVRVTFDMLQGQVITSVVPHEQVEKARDLYGEFLQAEAAEELGLASVEERDEAKRTWSEYIELVRSAARESAVLKGERGIFKTAAQPWSLVEGAFVEAFTDHFEREL